VCVLQTWTECRPGMATDIHMRTCDVAVHVYVWEVISDIGFVHCKYHEPRHFCGLVSIRRGSNVAQPCTVWMFTYCSCWFNEWFPQTLPTTAVSKQINSTSGAAKPPPPYVYVCFYCWRTAHCIMCCRGCNTIQWKNCMLKTWNQNGMCSWIGAAPKTDTKHRILEGTTVVDMLDAIWSCPNA